MKVLVADNYPLIREGLIAILSREPFIKEAEQASNFDMLLQKIGNFLPDIVILDIELGKACGFELIKEIRKRHDSCKFIIFTSSKHIRDFNRAEEAGLDGYILKEAFPEEIILGVKLVSKGRKYYDPSILNMILKKRNRDQVDGLTPREKDVLKELAKGIPNRQIAKNLFITEYTVKKHISQILTKLSLADRTQAALYANNKTVNI